MVAPVRRTDHVRHMRLSETDPNMAPKVEARCVNQILSERPYLKSDRIFCEMVLVCTNILLDIQTQRRSMTCNPNAIVTEHLD